MIFTPSGATFSPPPNSGNIQQGKTSGPIRGVLISNGGTGYQVTDVLNVTNGSGGQLLVLNAPGGAVKTVQLIAPGTGYNTGDLSPVTGGHGSGCEVKIAAPIYKLIRLKTAVNGRVVRDQSPRPPTPNQLRYAGTYILNGAIASVWSWCKKRLSVLANYWLNHLDPSGRSQWDTFATGSHTGFETFMLWNKIAGPAVGDPSDPGANIRLIPYPLPPGSSTPPIQPSSITPMIQSPSNPNGVLAAIQTQDATFGSLYRVYTTLPNPNAGAKNANPLIALASGTLTRPTNGIFFQFGLNIEIICLNGYPNPMTFLYTLTWTNNAPGLGNQILSVASTSSPAHPGIQFTASAGFTTATAYLMQLIAPQGTYSVTWTATVSQTLDLSSGPVDDGTIGINSTTQNTSLTGQTAKTPDNIIRPFPDVFGPPFNGESLRLIRLPNSTRLDADFTTQYLNIFGPPKQGQLSNLAIRLLDPSTGAFTDQLLSTTIAS